MGDAPAALEPRLKEYLQSESLRPLLELLRQRLERNGLRVNGVITVGLDDDGADKLGGLLGRAQQPGRVRVRLEVLDRALRASAANLGLIAVLTELGGPLVDRPATREQDRRQRADVWRSLDTALVEGGFASAGWVQEFVEGVRRSGLVARLVDRDLAQFAAVLSTVAPGSAMGLAAASGPAVAEPRWELAELASRCTGDAHGLDDGRVVATLVLRAIAVATRQPAPASAAERRGLWMSVGVTSDEVSGTVLTWGLRPIGDEEWAAMMRERARQGLVTHLALAELRSVPGLALADETVFACENPQVLQAAARARVKVPLVCFSGNPSAAALFLLQLLVSGGARVAYHGDFDWPGVAIADRLYARGAVPWRMNGADYATVAGDLAAESGLALTGAPVPTPWDPELSRLMLSRGLAVHEESLLSVLLTDLRQTPL
jgi:uncharacterized protein (TIGR02679 family)